MLYLHLVAAISLLIALGGVVAMLHSLRDSVLPLCFESPSFFEGEGSPVPPIVDVPVELDPTLLQVQEECYPSTAEALRSSLDAGIVAVVAGAAWSWHLRRGRRGPEREQEPATETPLPES